MCWSDEPENVRNAPFISEYEITTHTGSKPVIEQVSAQKLNHGCAGLAFTFICCLNVYLR